MRAFAPWRARAGAGDGMSDDALLAAFARHETAVQRARPRALYPEVLAAVLEAISRECDVPATAAECASFGESVGDWPAFPDSAPALAALKRRFRLCILSNVDRASFGRSADRLGTAFDYVFTAQDIGTYKPDPRNFRYMAEKLAADGIPRAGILHVAQSLYHDHAPARAAGLRSVWIDRRAGRPGGATAPAPDAHFDARFETMEAFAVACA